MADLLWLIPGLPYVAFLILAVAGDRLSRWLVATISCAAAALSLSVAVVATAGSGASFPLTQVSWTWIDAAGFSVEIGFYLDAVSALMVLVVTGVGFLILLYSTRFMEDDDSYGRFFAYMNLFIGSMLVLVLADNLVLLYLGWEGVGLCSYLLIGFWYQDPENGRAARKAFIVTRVGDAALAIGLFLIFQQLGTLNIQEMMVRAEHAWTQSSGVATAAALLLLIGAMGKSAQVPLQTWLPDAMAGPTPVSALIHAATMVTAGVYLIARTHVLFQLAPMAQSAVGIVGALTLLLAGCAALAQRDIKRILAYSTISQIGYMFLALGVGAWTAALFHFVTHAFFKALLFLGAGVVISSLGEEHDIFKMGGLRHRLPVTFWTFLVASASLAAFPLVTGGFYSKDLILWKAWSSPSGSALLWAAGLAGALLTALYTFRMVFVTFFGELKSPFRPKRSLPILIPLVTLAAGAVFSGLLQVPDTLGGHPYLSDFLGTALPTTEGTGSMGTELLLQLISGAVALAGILMAYVLYLKVPELTGRAATSGIWNGIRELWFAGWGFDWAYDRLLVTPYTLLARLNRDDVLDRFPSAIAEVSEALHRLLRRTQSGKLRWYTAGVVVGAVSGILLLVFL